MVNPLALSDEDFMKQAGPEPVADDPPDDAPIAVVEDAAIGVSNPESILEAPVVAEEPAPVVADTVVEETPPVAAEPVSSTEPEVPGGVVAAEPAPAGEVAAETPPNYEDMYNKIMTPFKANGKMIELRSPEEAISLMQMGANYTKKLQELQPHRKLIMMLQNNGLLDEGKLSFLIDVDRKNPEAIKKLVKDSGIDPLDIDVNSEPTYTEGNHRVSDSEVVFRQALEEVSSTPGGQEFLNEIDTSWDNASKDVLWGNPEILSIIQTQRENGIYAMIQAEADRQKILGKLSPTMPFLQAYKQVGDELAAANAFASLSQAPGQEQETVVVNPEPKVVATRVAAPKSPVANGQQASAASSTRSVPAAAAPPINYLAMSDDDFIKSMEGRV